MKKRKRIAALALGLAVTAVTAVTGYANSEARRDTSGMTLVEHREYYDGDFFIVDDVYFDNSPHTDIAGDDDNLPECSNPDIPDESNYGLVTAEAFDVTEMTKIDHREYTQNGLFIVDDVYYAGADASEPAAGDAAVLAVGDDVWVEGKVAINRSIYDNPDLNYGELLATMYLGAQFEWNGKTARVKKDTDYSYTIRESAGINKGIEITNEFRTCADNQGANILLGNKYAYIEYTMTIKKYPGYSNGIDFRLYASVNRYGVKNYAE